MKSMRKLILFVFVAVFTLFLPVTTQAHPHIIEATEKTEISPEALLEDLRSAQVIFLGEFHDHAGHHRAQLTIIDALDDDERPLAIGLEMFRKDSQETLNRWTANDLPFLEFLSVYEDNWSMWEVYREIFMHARNEEVKMLGLNIPRSITNKVLLNGFKALPEEERQMLGNVQCVVTPVYGDYIRQAMGGYVGHGDQFLHFCEAQLLWDTMMARNLVDFLQENPEYRVVVLAGSGHAWKFGIPTQMLEQAEISYRVLLPEVVSRVDRQSVTREITDYLWLDEGEDGWTFPN
ncbi:MAG: ChaN family lipoprotein [Desulfuromonadales bacterium]|jgi:uncharacterized iron-regulated protein|nr:ChaN family lipoprotein [Desulfuromonadales bacterium]MDH3869064.1 ChaN family lipoprotein [Desulfuromonadales bacterium]MDH4025462.1 ChaN family lipoprotein [Desulfuromonadales bacterium]HKJ29329.1 ChaN family lipoprotein [Desulfuromonadales bacterium]